MIDYDYSLPENVLSEVFADDDDFVSALSAGRKTGRKLPRKEVTIERRPFLFELKQERKLQASSLVAEHFERINIFASAISHKYGDELDSDKFNLGEFTRQYVNISILMFVTTTLDGKGNVHLPQFDDSQELAAIIEPIQYNLLARRLFVGFAHIRAMIIEKGLTISFLSEWNNVMGDNLRSPFKINPLSR